MVKFHYICSPDPDLCVLREMASLIHNQQPGPEQMNFQACSGSASLVFLLRAPVMTHGVRTCFGIDSCHGSRSVWMASNRNQIATARMQYKKCPSDRPCSGRNLRTTWLCGSHHISSECRSGVLLCSRRIFSCAAGFENQMKARLAFLMPSSWIWPVII